ncbi:MAG: hypothetical protein Q7R60_01420 [bacterium]|nr:hypothetical protein [bacterium]
MAKTIKRHGASVLILGLLMAGAIWYAVSLPGQAANTTNESDTISTSATSTAANHLIYFLTPSGVQNNSDTITLDFANTFSFANVTTSDIDIATSTATSNCPGAGYAEIVLVGTADTVAGAWGWATSANQVMTFTPSTAPTITTNTCVRIKIGSNATSTLGTGATGVTNPSASGVVDIDIAGGFGDTGKMKVAILGGVVVTATVAETLTATLNASSTCAGLITNGTNVESATNTIAFGTPVVETFYNSCQRLEVGTNANNGYVATLHKTQKFTSGSNLICDGAGEGTNCAVWTDQTPGCDGGCSTTTESTWSTATNNGFGYCMKDMALAGAQVADSGWDSSGSTACGGASQSFKLVGNRSADAENIMKSNSATSTNKAAIGYRLSIGTVQTPGDYTTTLIYIVTPTY